MRSWIKLFTARLFAPDWGRLSDGAFRVLVLSEMLAGHVDRDGEIGTVDELVWHLRLPEDRLQAALAELRAGKFVEQVDGVWHVLGWSTEQARPPSAMPEATRERKRQSRTKGRNTGHEPVTSLSRNVTTLEQSTLRAHSRAQEDAEHTRAAAAQNAAAACPFDDFVIDQLALYREAFGSDAPEPSDFRDVVESLWQEDRCDWFAGAVKQAVVNSADSPWLYIRGTLAKCRKTGRPPGAPKPGGNGKESRTNDDAGDDGRVVAASWINAGANH